LISVVFTTKLVFPFKPYC